MSLYLDLSKVSISSAPLLSGDDSGRAACQELIPKQEQKNIRNKTWRELLGLKVTVPIGPRVVHFNNPQTNQNQIFTSNYIKTTKYTWLTFLPKNLFEQFLRLANAYFLLVAIIQMIPGISPISPVTSLFPLIFVLTVSAIKEAIEDYKRRRLDEELNNRTTKVIRNCELVECKWKDIVVGDFVQCCHSSPIPADIVILSSSNTDGLCYIETSNLDGETNLKIREAKPETRKIVTPMDFQQLKGFIECEQPNNNLNTFIGRIMFDGQVPVPLTYKQMLLRGCTLKNTDWVIGVVVYTGHETKLMKNSTASPIKRTNLENQMNRLILYIFIFMGLMCFLSALGAGIWQNSPGNNHWYLHDLTPAATGITSFAVFMILFNTVIPISLYVSLEVVKLYHAYFVNEDLRMFDPVSNTPARARTSNLSENLGQIKYVFSDKTGTLTQNVMEFYECIIDDVAYGVHFRAKGQESLNIELKEQEMCPMNIPADLCLEKGTRFYDKRLSRQNWLKQPNAENIRRFFTVLAVCHTVIPEVTIDNNVRYQAASPDENALVIGAKSMGFCFYRRTPDEISIRVQQCTNMQPEFVEEVYQVLNIIEFDSTRKRMSVIVKCPDGKIKLLCKGADCSVFPRLTASQPHHEETQSQLQLYGDEGLRTLCIAERTLDEGFYSKWNHEYNKALGASEQESKKELDRLVNVIENDLELLGATAIEDKLQDGVPQCIETLRKAGIHIWLLTGDKQETAINVAFASRLFDKGAKVIAINSQTAEDVKSDLEAALEDSYAILSNIDNKDVELSLVIEGESLTYALEKSLNKQLLDLTRLCKTVICCRISPLQKAQIVCLVKDNTTDVTLSIGDGANDVQMIKSAHIGVGISGNEGLQACMASDYSIAQFKFLCNLLLVHGRWNYRRICIMINYSFFKNIAFSLTQFWFAIFSGFSGQTLHDSWNVSLFNVFFTAFPILFVGGFEQDISADTIPNVPFLYRYSQQNNKFNLAMFFLWFAEGLVSSLVYFFLPFAVYSDIPIQGGRSAGVWMMGLVIYICCVVGTNLRLALEIKHWTVWNHISIWGSIVFYFIFAFIYQALPFSFLKSINTDYSATDMMGLMAFLVGDLQFWMVLILSCMVSLLPVFTIKFYYNINKPGNSQIIRERMLNSMEVNQDMIAATTKRKQTKSLMANIENLFLRNSLQVNSGFSFSQQPGQFPRRMRQKAYFKNKKH